MHINLIIIKISSLVFPTCIWWRSFESFQPSGLPMCHQQHQPQGRTSTLFGNGHMWWSTKEYMVEWDEPCCTYASSQGQETSKAYCSRLIGQLTFSFIPSQINQASHPRHATYPGELCLLLNLNILNLGFWCGFLHLKTADLLLVEHSRLQGMVSGDLSHFLNLNSWKVVKCCLRPLHFFHEKVAKGKTASFGRSALGVRPPKFLFS